jgi:pilus assembly protein CpaF
VTRHARIEERIRGGLGPSPDVVREVVGADAARLGAGGVADAAAALVGEVWGLGQLEECFSDPAVTDVLVNGDGGVWLDRGEGLERSVVTLPDAGAARRLAVRLAGQAGRRLDESQPWVDGLLPGGIRLHAVLPPLVEHGPHLSLRAPRLAAPTLARLHDTGMFGDAVHGALRALVGARRSFVVTGGTGSGKTTLLAAMLAAVDPGERIVVVEDVRELAIAHPHVVRLQGRAANVEGVGAVTLVDLVRQALRMRPDRLVVGEVRGPEVREMLAALNTGHEGGCGTVHANAPGDVPARFEALGALAGLGRDAVHAQLSSAIEAVVHLERSRGRRLVHSVSVLQQAGQGFTCEVALDGGTGVRGAGWAAFSSLVGGDPR